MHPHPQLNALKREIEALRARATELRLGREGPPPAQEGDDGAGEVQVCVRVPYSMYAPVSQ